MTNELHLGPQDFTLTWFSGRGAGGQHRNKHQNCCRIVHNETGLSAIGTASRSRVANQRHAFQQLAARILAYYATPPERRDSAETIRTYRAVRNDVKDHASGKRMLYTEVVDKGELGPMIEARAKAMAGKMFGGGG